MKEFSPVIVLDPARIMSALEAFSSSTSDRIAPCAVAV